MGQDSPVESDRWADWLIRGRQRGLSERQISRMGRRLNALRNRVIAGARLRQGHSVLDLGAGTGMLAAEAVRRVGPSGRVVALDISQRALAESVAKNPEVTLDAVVADASRLPFSNASFDAVVIRSVLIYLIDKKPALAEIARVLRPSGRVSLFEPINRRYSAVDWERLGLGDAAVAHRRVIEHLREGSLYDEAMLNFDERDLSDWLSDAGFSTLEMRYELKTSSRRRLSADEVRAMLATRPNPGAESYEEGARAVLGADADPHLLAIAAVLTSQPVAQSEAAAYIVARR